MPFKEGVEDAHVNSFRSIRRRIAELDELIDFGTITPYEAMVELTKFIEAVEIPAPKSEKKKAA